MKTVETDTIGNVKYRLVEDDTGRQRIQLWSSVSKQWRVMYRYSVQEVWDKLKVRHEQIRTRISER